MLYAIVDIETTGGYAGAGGITEIAVVISDGKKVLQQYQTLLNPVYTIPKYVEALTGITNAMVENEKHFSMVAAELFEMLHDKVFVAHNVNFDYSFIKYNLSQHGFYLDCKKLCTVRLGRKIIQGSPGYSLGKICRHLGINIEERHRAGGDAQATTQLFHHLLQNDHNGFIEAMLKVKSKEQSAPPNLPVEQMKKLPDVPGVYYFHDEKGKVIYVGKAKSLSKRVNSHFSNNNPAKQKQEFLRKIHNITYQTCGTELMAFILESVEIKKLWPQQNRSQKRFEQSYALYPYEDRNGYMRLAIEKKNKNLRPLYTFNLLAEGYALMRKLCSQFRLCPKLCFLQSSSISCAGIEENNCNGACEQKETAVVYNSRVQQCIDFLHTELPTFALVDFGLQKEQLSCILMEKGRFYGMGYLPNDHAVKNIDDIKIFLTPYSENEYIRGLIYQHATKFPHKKKVFVN